MATCMTKLLARGQSTSCGTQEEAGVTPQTFGRLKADESGVAPAQHGALAASNCSAIVHASASVVLTSLWARGDAKGDPHRVTPVFLRRSPHGFRCAPKIASGLFALKVSKATMGQSFSVGLEFAWKARGSRLCFQSKYRRSKSRS